MRYDFAIIILNYKTAKMTMDCANSALNDIEDKNACIIIVDNFSNDGSKETLSSWISKNALEPKVQLIPSDINSGFSGGNNMGMQQVEADYYILLNSDTLVRQGAFSTILNTFKLDDSIGMVSPRLEDEDGTGQISCFKFHNPISEFINIANTGLFTKLFKRYNVPVELKNHISYPEWTSFACVALKKNMIDSIGLMDDHYFLYYEDSDYCKMAINKGWRTANNPNAHVIHFRGGSAELKTKIKLKQRLPQYHYDSRSYYYRKHYGQLGLLAANILWSLGRCISKFREVLQQKPRAASELQWLDIWTGRKFFTSKN
jgi:N-acetylglucosaminyl-diphospho-decaprenol L-rhamnosyltransferase